MTKSSQLRAVANHRRRLAERGISRYEVRGLERDKELVRKLAKRLAEDNSDAARLRERVAREIFSQSLSGKEIWEALQRSPAVGIELDLEREITTGRDVDL